MQAEAGKAFLALTRKPVEFQLVNAAKGRVVLAELSWSEAAGRGSVRGRSPSARSVTQAALPPPDRQPLRTAASASQRSGRESLPGELPSQRQRQHEGYPSKMRGELEQEFHHME